MSRIPLEPLCSRVAAHLDEPAVAEWALTLLRDLRHLQLGEERRLLEDAWFGDPARVARWLGHVGPRLGWALLSELPPQRFSAAVELLAERWNGWSDERTQPAALALATLAPAQAARLFRAALAAEPTQPTCLAILEAGGLTGAEAEALEEAAHARLAIGAEPAEPQWLARRLRSEAGLAAGSTLPALTRWLGNGNFAERLAWIAEPLYGHAAFFALAVEFAKGNSPLGFAAISPVFPRAAPLARWDELLVSERERSLPELVHDLERKVGSHPAAGFTIRLVTSLSPVSSPEEQRLLAALAVAALAHTWELAAPHLGALSVEALLELADLWLPRAPFHRELARALAEKPRDQVMSSTDDYIAVSLALGLPLNLSPRRLEALAELEEPALAPLFLDALHQDAHDTCLEAAAAALARLGEVATHEIIRRFHRLDFWQRAGSLDLLGTLGGAAVVNFFAADFDELAADFDEQFGSAVVQQLEPRLLAPLAARLADEEPWVVEAFLVLATLLGDEHPRLEEARVRWAEHQAEDQAERAAARAAPDELALPLSCAACGHRAVYACRRIFWSLEGGGEPMLADELPCAGCGRVTDLLVLPEAWPTLTAELARSAGATAEEPLPSPVYSDRLTVADGRTLPVSAAFTDLRRRDALGSLDLAGLLEASATHRTAFRFLQATHFRRRAVALDPAAIEAFWGLTNLLREQGHQRAAFNVLRQALEHEPRWFFALSLTDLTLTEFRRRFAELYTHLRTILQANEAPPAPSSLTEKKPKVGRNEPCPCGSGKKFKRCCGG